MDVNNSSSINNNKYSDPSWKLALEEGRIGTGNWNAFPQTMLNTVFEAANDWKDQLKGIDNPWLCWCVEDDWCYIQQKLVHSVGWTPVVGTDGRIPMPKLFKGSIFIDFNKLFGFKMMFMHFPIEFSFLFCDRLAFWHSDVLPPVSAMERIRKCFEYILDGEMILTRSYIGWIETMKQVCIRIKEKHKIYRKWFEVVGCTTAGASLSQYENGCGFWRNPQNHPNAGGIVKSLNPHWEHTVGVTIWGKYFNGKIRELPVDVNPYHYCISRDDYKRMYSSDGKIIDSKYQELRKSYDLDSIVRSLNID